MKHLLLIFAALLVLNSCSKDDDGGTLPPITQTGANTVGCLVNGKVYLPHQEGINPSVNCFYQLVNGEFFFSIDFADLRGGANESVNVFTAKVELEENQTYILDQPDTPEFGGGGEYRLGQSNQYNTSLIHTGELTINRIDLSNSIVSGTFWFDAINEEGEVVEIREGRFDWNY